MVKTTVGDILASKVNASSDKLIYFIRDNNFPIYVGQSFDVCMRIKTHCGFGSGNYGTPDMLGEFIHINYPASSKWQVDLLSLDECELISRQYFTEKTIFDVDIVEQALILHFGPCLNLFHNQNNPNIMPIPEKYNKNCIPEQFNNLDSDKKKNKENAYRDKNSSIEPLKEGLKLQTNNNNIFQNYRQNLSKNTINSQKRSLNIFQDYLGDIGFAKSNDKQFDDIKEILTEPSGWRIISREIIEKFVEWLLNRGFAISSINLIITHIRKYAKLAFQDGVIAKGIWEQIKEIKNIYGERAEIFEKERENKYIPSPKNPSHRVGRRKIQRSINITEEKAKKLKSFPSDNEFGRRANLIMCLLLDQGLKSKDLDCLRYELVDMDLKVFYLERSNRGKQPHLMTNDTFKAFQKIFEYHDVDVPGHLFFRTGQMWHISKDPQQPLNKRSFYWVINQIGKSVGLDNLNEVDCRVYWVSKAVRSGSDIFDLQRSGGWTNIKSVLRHLYEIESTEGNQEDIQDSD